MVNKTYCDRCNKEMKLADASYVKVGNTRLSQVGNGNAEVCSECANEIIAFVKSKAKGRNNDNK